MIGVPNSHCPCGCISDHRDFITSRTERSGDCWIWMLRVDRDGYGRVTHRGKGHAAHRFSYEAFVGVIADGMTIDHLCRNRACVNPDHLEAVSNEENIRRGYEARGFARRAPRSAPKRTYLSRANVGADDPRHGTYSGYNNLPCRCEPCRSAASAYRRAKANTNGALTSL